jgi:6-phosphogluconolactonase
MFPRICTALLLICCAVLLSLPHAANAAAKPAQTKATNFIVYFGTRDKAIYACRFNSSTGQMESLGAVADIERPSWLAMHPKLPILYAVSELGNDGKEDGWIYSYKVDARTGKLQLFNKVSATGGGTTHVAIDKSGKFLLAVNFGGGQVVAFRINPDGTIGEQTAKIQHFGSGPDPERQGSPHPHQVNLSSDNRYVIVPDRALDRIFTYRLDPQSGALTPAKPPSVALPPASAPRHFTFHPNGRFGYVITELQATIVTYNYTPATGELKPIQTVSTIPDNFTGTKSGSEVWVEPSGRYLYAASRSDDTILLYSIDPGLGTLSLLQRVSSQGSTPRYLTADPTGQFMFVTNERANQVVLFRIDRATGKLSPTGQTLNMPFPGHVLFVPAEKP